jgi:hypothetical protein
MAKIGVQQLFAFPIETEVEGALPTYGEPFRIAKAIQVDLTPNVVEASLDGDDSEIEYETAITRYDLSLNIDDLAPGVEGQLLGKKVDSLGGVASNVNDEAPYFAVAFRIPRSRGVGGGFAESFQTKGENINFQTPTLTGRSLARDFDNQYNYKLTDDGTKPAVKAVTDKWFEEVAEPAAPVTP